MTEIKKTWNISALQSCLLEADPKTHYFTMKNLVKNHLDRMIKEIGVIGKTPKNTLSKVLQDFRDAGFLSFIDNNGLYQMIPNEIDMKEIIHKKEKKIKMSNGERMICNILKNLGIDFTREKTFKDLKHKSYLRFDFYFEINGRGFAVEFDGEQHRKPIAFFGGEVSFQQTIIRDIIKNEYCEKNDLILIRIDENKPTKAFFKIIKAIIGNVGKSVNKGISKDINEGISKVAPDNKISKEKLEGYYKTLNQIYNKLTVKK